MSRFWQDAVQVLETATEGDAELGLLVDESGAIRIVDATGWRPEALQAHYGVRTVFQVSHTASTVRVMGRCGDRSCTMEADRPARRVPPLPVGMPLYTVSPIDSAGGTLLI